MAGLQCRHKHCLLISNMERAVAFAFAMPEPVRAQKVLSMVELGVVACDHWLWQASRIGTRVCFSTDLGWCCLDNHSRPRRKQKQIPLCSCFGHPARGCNPKAKADPMTQVLLREACHNQQQEVFAVVASTTYYLDFPAPAVALAVPAAQSRIVSHLELLTS